MRHAPSPWSPKAKAAANCGGDWHRLKEYSGYKAHRIWLRPGGVFKKNHRIKVHRYLEPMLDVFSAECRMSSS
jgi:hypothetical protein